MAIAENITTLMRRRFSCRTYSEEPISDEKRQKLQDFMQTLPAGPFGDLAHFQLIAARPQDSEAIKDLGTYGFI